MISKRFHTAALVICEEQDEPNAIQIADTCNNLGIVHTHLGDLQQAKQYFERALDICIKQLGPIHIHVATSYNSLGVLHIYLGAYNKPSSITNVP